MNIRTIALATLTVATVAACGVATPTATTTETVYLTEQPPAVDEIPDEDVIDTDTIELALVMMEASETCADVMNSDDGVTDQDMVNKVEYAFGECAVVWDAVPDTGDADLDKTIDDFVVQAQNTAWLASQTDAGDFAQFTDLTVEVIVTVPMVEELFDAATKWAEVNGGEF